MVNVGKGRKKMTLSLKQEAYDVLIMATHTRGYGDLVSELILDYDRRQRGMTRAEIADELRRLADDIDGEASEAAESQNADTS